MRASSLFLIAVLASGYSYAIDTELDSIINELAKVESKNLHKIKLLYEEGHNYLITNPSKSLEYGRAIYALSSNANYDIGLGLANKLIGDAFQTKSAYDSSNIYYEKAIELFQCTNAIDRLTDTYNNYGVNSYYLGNYAKAIACFNIRLEAFIQSTDTARLISTLGNLGLVYSEVSDYQKALDYYFQVLRLETKHTSSNRIGLAYENIGETYLKLKDYESASYYASKALSEYEENTDLVHYVSALNLMGKVNYLQKHLNLALDNFKTALTIGEHLKEEIQKGIAKQFIGLVYKELGKTNLAIEFLHEAQNIFESIGIKKENSETLLNLGELYSIRHDKKQAEEFMISSLSIAKLIGARDIQMRALSALAVLKKKQQNFKSSLQYYEDFISLRDSLFNEEKSRQIIEIQNKYEAERKEKFIHQQNLKISNQKAELLKNTSSNRAVIFVFSSIIFLLSASIGSLLLKHKYDNLKNSELLLASKVATLKNQLSPHFLFNSLNVLSSLINKNHTKADAFIFELSKLYRYILDNIDRPLVINKDEINFTKSFFEILKMRFGDKINMNISLDQDVLDNHCVPPMTLQLLIENAVKHNMISKENPLELEITKKGDKYMLIKNNLNKKDKIHSTRLGLKNLKFIYSHLFHKEIIIIEDQFFFYAFIPLIKYHAHDSVDNRR